MLSLEPVFERKGVGEHGEAVASRQKTDTKKFKTGLLLGFLDGKAYICSESLSERVDFENKGINMIGERNSI